VRSTNLTGSLLAAALWAAPVAAQQPSSPDLGRPAFALLRQDEDWLGFRSRSRARTRTGTAEVDFWDHLKAVPVNDDSSATLTVGGSGRLRFDQQRNLVFGGAEDDDARFLWRGLLHGALDFAPYARAFVEVEHASTTDGDLPGGRRPQDVESIALQQGFVDLTLPDVATLRLGRQAFALGSQRIVSPAPWSNTLRRWDGASLQVGADELSATGFWTQAVPGRPHKQNEADHNEQFFGAFLSAKDPSGDELDVFYFGRVRDRIAVAGTQGGEERHTLGGRIAHVGAASWDGELEGAWQFGRVGPGSIAAWMVAGELGFEGDDAWQTSRTRLGFQLASGDDRSGENVQTFDPMYPDDHRHLGLVDAVGQRNVGAVWLGHRLDNFASWSFDGAVYSFWRWDKNDALYGSNGAPLARPTTGAGKHIGIELDVVATYALDRHRTVRLGWGYLWAGDYLSDTGSSKDRQRVFAEVEYTF